MYLFVNPLSPEYWSIDPIIQKLQVEYGDLFKLTHFLTGGEDVTPSYRSYTPIQPFSYVLEQESETHDEPGWLKQPLFLPHPAFLAIKAAQCYGKKVSAKFLHQLQIAHFFDKKNLKNKSVLKQCAIDARLDLEEFECDIHLDTVKNALHADFKVANELQVSDTPTLIFYSSNVNEPGVKVHSHYHYDVYANIIRNSSNLDVHPPYSPPPLEEFIRTKSLVTTETLAMLYNKSLREIDLEMKKLVLKRKVQQKTWHSITFWKTLDI